MDRQGTLSCGEYTLAAQFADETHLPPLTFSAIS